MAILPFGSVTTRATTQAAGDNSTLIATDAFVTTAVNNAIAGVNPAVAVSAATTSASNTSGFTYSNGASGIGATLTQNSAAVYTVDGFTFSATTQRLLVKNDTQSPSGAFNGIYLCTTVGTSLIPAVFTRALDYDTPSDINNTGSIPVINGTVNGSTSWVQTAQITTVGTTPLAFTQFTLSPTTLMTTTTYDPAAIAQQVVGTTATQTLSNKTLTAPVISSIVNTGTLTLPTATTTLVGRSTTDTLTNKTLDSTSPTAFFYPGFIQPYAGFIGSALSLVPSGWLACYGQAVSQSTYANLFSAICPNLGAVAITNASPAVVTLSGHGFVTGDQIYFNGSGTINAGLSQNTNYFVIYIGANTFNLATTLANAEAGTKIATTGALSGTINCYAQPYGGASSTTFNVPDLRGNVLAGADAMGGTAASRLTLSTAQGTYGMLGATGGEQSHTIVTAELASHNHGVTDPGHGHTTNFASGSSGSYTYVPGGNGTLVGSNSTVVNTGTTGISTQNAGSGGAHNNVQPTVIVNYIIKT